MEILHRYRMDDCARWITQLSWSEWTMFTDGTRQFAMASLAVADSAGAVWSVEITQEVTLPRFALQVDLNGMEVDQDASGISAAQPLPIGTPDRRPVEHFKWITTQFGVSKHRFVPGRSTKVVTKILRQICPALFGLHQSGSCLLCQPAAPDGALGHSLRSRQSASG